LDGDAHDYADQDREQGQVAPPAKRGALPPALGRPHLLLGGTVLVFSPVQAFSLCYALWRP
jgi:hypothetical protein